MAEKFNDSQWRRKLDERIKSNIMQKWDKTDTMMDDLRQFILEAKDAGGPDLVRDIADALKLMTNYAMGEYKKAKRR
jgi:phosphoribosylpyrophosphate synthetase